MSNVDNKFVLRKSFKFITYLDSVEGKPIIFEVNRWWTGIHSICCTSFTVSRQSMWQLYHVDGFIICKQCKPVKVHPRILKKGALSITSDGQNTDEVRLVSFLQLATRTPPLLASPPSAFSSFLGPPCNKINDAIKIYSSWWMPSRISLYTVPADPSAGCCASPCSRWSPRPCHSAASPGFLSASLDTDL